MITSEPITAEHLREAIGFDAQESVDQLGDAGVTATGDTGESEPLAAIADSLQAFPADRVLLFMHSESEQSYRESVTAAEITERFGLPVIVREIAS